MVIKCYNEKHLWLLFIDTEFDQQQLVQFSGALFKRIDDDTYQLAATINQYITTSVSMYFQDYTKITQDFLVANGIPLESLKDLIFGEVLKNVDMKDVMIISHGLKNDRLVLKDNGINFNSYEDIDGKIKPVDGYCTFNNAKRVLERDKKSSALLYTSNENPKAPPITKTTLFLEDKFNDSIFLENSTLVYCFPLSSNNIT